jgi:hypothetical protein
VDDRRPGGTPGQMAGDLKVDKQFANDMAIVLRGIMVRFWHHRDELARWSAPASLEAVMSANRL